MNDIKAYMADIKSKPHGQIEPLPEFHAYEAFTYQANELRSPFSKPVVVEVMETTVKESINLFPDFDRTKEYLERFAITTLSMVGTLSREQGFLWALISDENGDVHRVKVGNYLGQNHGQITDVTELGIQVLEIIPDGDGGWIQRPRAIQIEGLEE
ncbi:pilus assembly protein PilP [Litoribrevibacter euphylliae]|uniref:Pilus assembly protein PilP n=1 Tax=Litoribrevibacter euphylliae TaxID=1834034 RepID=A0ABV7HI54_9GAMM